MKKPSSVYSTQPVAHNFFLAQATLFNSTSTTAKYKLEYSLDGGASWQMTYSIDSLDNAYVAYEIRMPTLESRDIKAMADFFSYDIDISFAVSVYVGNGKIRIA